MYNFENGIAPSRANAYVHRLAAVKLPTPAKNKTPRIKNNKPNPPPALPVTILNSKGIGCPVATESKVCTSGNTKRIGTSQKIPVIPAAKTDKTMAFGTSCSGLWTSSHIAATIPYPVIVYADSKRPTKNAHPGIQPDALASKWPKTKAPERREGAITNNVWVSYGEELQYNHDDNDNCSSPPEADLVK